MLGFRKECKHKNIVFKIILYEQSVDIKGILNFTELDDRIVTE